MICLNWNSQWSGSVRGCSWCPDGTVAARPDVPLRIRLDAVLHVSFALYIGIQAAEGDADSYLAFYLNAFKRTSSKDVRQQQVEQIADGVETQCSHQGGNANVHHS